MAAKFHVGQVTVGARPAPLSTATLEAKSLVIKNPSDSGAKVWFGDSDVTESTGYLLAPGEEFTFNNEIISGRPIFDVQPQIVYVGGSSGDVVCWLAAGH